VLLLDVMGTLVRDPFYDVVPEFFGMSLDELIAVKHPHAWVAFERDHIAEPQMLAEFFADGRDYDRDGLVAAMKAAYDWLPGIASLLEDLSATGIEMHTLSNYPQWYRYIEDALTLSRWVRWTFVSCKTGLRKPEPAAYRQALAALGVRPDEAIFVDDREDNCEGAAAEGIDAIRFENAAGLSDALQQRGLIGRG